MKKLLVILAALALCAGTANAFLGAGVRYASVGMSDFSGNSVNVNMIQGEVMIGPLEVGIGTTLGSATPIYPLTVGFVGKFPIPIVQPYIGGDFTYFIMPNNSFSLSGITGSVNMMHASGKAGVEVKFGNIAGFGGVGYGVTLLVGTFSMPGAGSYTGMVPLMGLTWEVGARYYIF